MTSAEKMNMVLNLEAPKKRSDIPVAPHIVTWAGTVSGLTQAEIISDGKKWLHALDKVFQVIGKPDTSFPNYPGDAVRMMGLPVRIPGRELGENELYQFIEKPFFTDEKEYQKILKDGWSKWYMNYLMKIQVPPKKNMVQMIMFLMKMGKNSSRVQTFLNKRGIEPHHIGGMQPIFDSLSLIRSLEEFSMDLYTNSDIIIDIIRKYQLADTKSAIGRMKNAKLKRTGMFLPRSCAPFVSPAIFEEFVWPYLKPSLVELNNAGLKTVIHADADWLPVLKYFTELPKASLLFDFDGVTDMFKAYEIIGGWHSMGGDVPATMLAFGTPDQVSEYCERIITGLCMKGGVMLGSGCEVPMNAKVECVKAMMDSVKQ